MARGKYIITFYKSKHRRQQKARILIAKRRVCLATHPGLIVNIAAYAHYFPCVIRVNVTNINTFIKSTKPTGELHASPRGMDKFDRRRVATTWSNVSFRRWAQRFDARRAGRCGRINVAPSSRFAENLCDDSIINLCIISAQPVGYSRSCTLFRAYMYRSLSVYRGTIRYVNWRESRHYVSRTSVSIHSLQTQTRK